MHIQRLAASIDGKKIVNNFSLQLTPGTVHAIMGPNGSGKSTLAHALAGSPLCHDVEGSAVLDGVELLDSLPEERARQGLFLGFQQPPAIPGVSVATFLKEAHHAITGSSMPVSEWYELLNRYCALLTIDPSFVHRGLNEGFSGGERKKCELLQLLVLKPKVAILDEIDSGLDIDALACVARGLHSARQENPTLRILLITHYQRILDHVRPDAVHIMKKGAIVASGDASLAHELEQKGYDAYAQE